MGLCSCAPGVKSSGPIEVKRQFSKEKFYSAASEALANREFYFDQRLDSITLAFYGKRFDEGIRTRMAGVRDRAKKAFIGNSGLARTYVGLGGDAPLEDDKLIELATWMKVAEAVGDLTDKEQLSLEVEESV